MLYQLSYTPAGGSASIRCAAPWQGAAHAARVKPRIVRKRRNSCFRRALLYLRPVHAPPPPQLPIDLLMAAYRSGIFPMADSREDPDVYWIEPRERAILPLEGFRCSRSLARTLRRDRFAVTCNRAFADVIAACAAPRPEHPESWISERIMASYRALHHAGHAHSIECWLDDRLVGGLYGVGFGRAFCGESMFSRTRDASKVALAWLVAALRRAGVQLLDCQFMTGHLASLGAIEISQQRYVELLDAAQSGADAPPLPEAFAALGEAAAGAGAAAAAGRAGTDEAGVDEAGASSPGYFIAQSLTQTS